MKIYDQCHSRSNCYGFLRLTSGDRRRLVRTSEYGYDRYKLVSIPITSITFGVLTTHERFCGSLAACSFLPSQTCVAVDIYGFFNTRITLVS